MKKKIILFSGCLLVTIGCIVSFILAWVLKFNDYDIFLTISSGLIGVLIPYDINFLIDLTDSLPWQTYLRKLVRLNLLKKNDTIRISYAYLFRIEVDGEYLLIKNSHGFNKYQPPGSTYSLSNKEKSFLKEKFLVKDDDRILSKKIKDDYRLFVPIKYMKPFFKRFCYQIDKVKTENYLNGFKHVLVDSNVLNHEIFSNVEFNYIRRDVSKIEYSKHFECYEMLLADIIEVKLNDKQIEEIRMMKNRTSVAEKYEFADEQLIKSCGVNTKVGDLYAEISEHTYKILPIVEE